MKPISVALLTSTQTAASGLYGLLDVLSSVGIVWETAVSGQPPRALFDVKIVASEGMPFRCATGGMIAPDMNLDETAVPDIAIVPGISASSNGATLAGDRATLEWLEDRLRRGTRIASACTGALVLAEAGLLDGNEATTHWAYRDLFRRRYPRVRLRTERNLCIASNGIVTSGGTTAWQQLALHLIENHCGREHAVRASKFWLLPDIGDLQAPFAAMTHGSGHEDSAIRRCQAWIADNHSITSPVEAMIACSALPPTTFARRFRRATGYAPIEYVHEVRVERARQMLETSDCPVEQIGGMVGYEDTASFRRLFKRITGLTPRDYRRLFGTTRFARLSGSAPAGRDPAPGALDNRQPGSVL